MADLLRALAVVEPTYGVSRERLVARFVPRGVLPSEAHAAVLAAVMEQVALMAQAPPPQHTHVLLHGPRGT